MKIEENKDFISTVDLHKKVKKKEDFTLLDVRTPAEYKTGHIKGSILLNLSENFLEDLDKIGLANKKNLPIVVYCRSGSRSQIIFNILNTLGFKNVQDMKEGLLEWKKNKLPLIK
ncbi:MAG: rhodanese-like domain-containing protein [Patescibacteria group bacterium]|nr:rhodanese-like domain-containing protein [Patescibacteria group bacterium]